MRDAGWKMGPSGKLVQHRFILGRDARAAERAAIKLEQLWRIIESESAATPPVEFGDTPPQPQWGTQTLAIAKAIAKGESQLVVPYYPTFEELAKVPDPMHTNVGANAYANHLQYLNVTYPVINYVPADPDAARQGQATYADMARHHARKANFAASVAGVPLPTGMGQSIYGALDTYAAHVREIKKREGKTTEWGRVLAENVLRLKRCSPDIPIEQIDATAVEYMVRYWTNRPKVERTGGSLSLASVEAHVKALRMFLKHIHRTPAFKWRGYPDVEDVLRVDFNQLMSDTEIAGLKNGVATFTIDELATLYRYATDRERVLIMLGMNCAFARAECVSLRKNELQLDKTPPRIARVRRKSRVYSEFSLWPETIKALEWLAIDQSTKDSPENPFVMITPRGEPLREIGIANAWNKLMNRVTKDHPTFNRLSIKYLRKTAGQFVRQMSDGETAGVFLSHGQPVRSDDLLDVYTNRDFAKVFTALDRVHVQLAPMFAAAPAAFTAPRKHGGPNISRATIEAIKKMHREGKPISEIASTLKLSRPSVYRWIKAQHA